MNAVLKDKADNHYVATWCIDVWGATPEEGALMAASMAQSEGTTATIFSVESQDNRVVVVDTEGGNAIVLRDEREATNQELVARLVEEIQIKLKQVLAISEDPVSIQINDRLDIELQPLCESDGDERVLIGRKDWGCTVVNYTSEGLILDVLSEDNPMDAYWTGAFSSDKLVKDEDSDGDHASMSEPEKTS